MKILTITIGFSLFLLSSCCIQENIQPVNTLKGKVRIIKISVTDSTKINIICFYDSVSARLSRILNFIKPPNIDTFRQKGEYNFRYENNLITIDEIGIDNVTPFHRYKINTDYNKNILDFNEEDVIYNTENTYFKYTLKNQLLDTVFEKYYWPFAFNRKCYNYVFDENNYTKFIFDYDWYVIFGGNVHVVDSAKIDYTNMPYTQYAPMQNMYSANTFFNLGIPSEVTYDLLYFLGLEGYRFYKPNKNLVNTIRSYNDSTAIVYMTYEFNTQNQLDKFIVNFRNPSTTFFTYEFEYY